ncbi:hypothetical protein EDC56_1199 [Sinobacterium caligoides]|uniref:Lipoprotein n=1 Tax=Sinobacterium caligoides TaxID=933926 RepID=A0A3N2E0L4_9GAMM|nr:hypothetical protein [Sinobacterium caligoides]ROS05653.1 hypothetical protein EDC56_1199 [Sinobacterium caligoides]
MGKRVLIIFVVYLLLGCASQESQRCPGGQVEALTTEQINRLEAVALNHHIVSSCVTEQLTERREQLCAACPQACQPDVAPMLSYSQWLEIYTHCTVKD